LQVGQDGEGIAQFRRGRAQRSDVGGVAGLIAVREVEARHVHAGHDHLSEHGRVAAGGPYGADDLGAEHIASR